MLLRSMQNTRRELADAKAENDALRDDVAAGRRRLRIKAVCQSVRKPPPPPAWIMQPPPDWQTPLSLLFHPQREADHYAKTTGKTRSILMSSADRVAHIDGQLMQLNNEEQPHTLWSINT